MAVTKMMALISGGLSTIIDGRSRSPIELTGNGTVFMHRTQTIRTEKGPPVLHPRTIPMPSPSIFVIKPISFIVTTLRIQMGAGYSPGKKPSNA
jgi:hypothetical protein